ncbi:hypothetical protein Clacol_000501 [Clathrus columnatus]|uniref:Uncharacterized protein n=1 Tax=Clathrus columnatus TaxID=1419009 RepID=A0AAV5A347_9AGAM|nr:hypothetical protein Clacol_000501 [Clathrus columnatus]
MQGLTGVFIISIIVILSLRFLTSNVFQIDNRNVNDLLKGLLQGISMYQALLSTSQLITIAFAFAIGGRLLRDFIVQQDPWKLASTLIGVAFGVLMADMLSYLYNDEEWNIFNVIDEYTSTRRSRSRRHPVRRRVSEPRRIEDIPSLYEEASSIDSQSHLGDQELSDTEKEVSRLRAKALYAEGQRRRCREERKWALSQGNLARAFQLRWQIKKYHALALSFTHEADQKLIENDRAKRMVAPAEDRETGRDIDQRQRQMPFVQVVVENGHESPTQEPKLSEYTVGAASHEEGSRYKTERHVENKNFYTVSGLGRRGGATLRVESPPTSDTWSRQLD